MSFYEKTLYTTTVKYFRLSLKEHIPYVKKLIEFSASENTSELEDILEMYLDISAKIDKYNLNFDDPNRYSGKEPFEISIADLNLSDINIEHLARLTLRSFWGWKIEIERLRKKQYLTDENIERVYDLEKFIWPLETILQSGGNGYVLSKYKEKGPVIFPGEVEKEKNILGFHDKAEGTENE